MRKRQDSALCVRLVERDSGRHTLRLPVDVLKRLERRAKGGSILPRVVVRRCE
ncbi:MAG: hypothetical protein ACK4S2_06070 [Gemmobacter sp.]